MAHDRAFSCRTRWAPIGSSSRGATEAIAGTSTGARPSQARPCSGMESSQQTAAKARAAVARMSAFAPVSQSAHAPSCVRCTVHTAEEREGSIENSTPLRLEPKTVVVLTGLHTRAGPCLLSWLPCATLEQDAQRQALRSTQKGKSKKNKQTNKTKEKKKKRPSKEVLLRDGSCVRSKRPPYAVLSLWEEVFQVSGIVWLFCDQQGRSPLTVTVFPPGLSKATSTTELA